MAMKIYNNNFIQKTELKNKDKNQNEQQNSQTPEITCRIGLSSKFNDHLITFKGRVDKGLGRFYERNKQIMPYTVRLYVQSLEDKSRLTPLQAQNRAFHKLNTATTLDDIKRDFPDETLFEDLINPEDAKARRGIINCIKENKELLELSEESALKNKENFTIYLLKKVFLEAKTIDEINNDLENDLNEDFKADFKFKNPDSKYVYSSTLKALGIKPPNFEYQQSLRYTRDGYSDIIGDKISDSLEAFYDSLTDGEKLARAKKSVKKFEKWWNSYSQAEKLEILADQENVLNMLKEYKKTERAEVKNKKLEAEKNNEPQPEKPRTHVKVGSEKLSQDELFKRWASNNLKIFEASLTEADKDSLHIKRMHNLVSRWKEMSAEERTDYISKMKSGLEPLRYTMIEAWNNSFDIITELSIHLKENQIYKPANLLYSTEEFSQFQSKIMTEFWESHPEFATLLGERIKEAQNKVEIAIKNGTFAELKNSIGRNKNDRIRALERFKKQTETIETTETSKEEPPKEEKTKEQNITEKPTYTTTKQEPQRKSENPQEPDYKADFKKAYNNHIYGRLKSMPKTFYNDMYEKTLEILPKEIVSAWTKNLEGKAISPEERKKIEEYLYNEPYELSRYNRALEAAMADALYEILGNPNVYRLSNSDVKTVMYHVERQEYPIEIKSHKLNETFVFNPIPPKRNKKVNIERVNFLYNKYKEDLTDNEIDDIINFYFQEHDKKWAMKKMLESPKNSTEDIIKYINEYQNESKQIREDLKKYIASYGKSALILFSEHNTFTASIKDAFNQKFFANMPENLKNQEIIEPQLKTKDNILKEQVINRVGYLYGERFKFVPQEFMKFFAKEMGVQLRKIEDMNTISSFIENACVKRKNAKENAKIIVFPKANFTIENKLKTIAMEQALADVLYEATENIEVYKLSFENLCDNLELFNLVKQFPSNERNYETNENEKIIISAKRKPNLHKIQKLYREYIMETSVLLKEYAEDKYTENEFYEELLYILNPEENNCIKDINILKRFSRFNFPVNNIKLYPNGIPEEEK